MSRRGRMALFLPAVGLLAALLVGAVGDLPSFGHYPGPYGIVLNETALAARHATDLVTAVNFDYRVYDTLGEEFILFSAVLGVAIVLRQRRGEHRRAPDEPGEEHHFPGSSSALGALGLGLVGPLIVLGVYVVTHGHLTPGGGFQGGVVLAAAALMAFLAGEYVALKIVAPHAMVESAEAVGAASLALIGLGGLLFASAFFENFLPLGTARLFLSGGTIPLANVGVGLEVAGAFLLLWVEFSDQALVVRS